MQILLLLLTILGGMGLSVEAGLLGPLGKEVGELWATFSIFGVGAALTFLLMLELGYLRKWNENLRSSLSAGSLIYKDSNFSENNPDQNKRLINASVNLFWTPVEKVDLGVEYTYGKRETFSDLEGKLSRINLLGRYNF